MCVYVLFYSQGHVQKVWLVGVNSFGLAHQVNLPMDRRESKFNYGSQNWNVQTCLSQASRY